MTKEKKYQELEDEFDKFTYIVSHDMRAPLRQISSFMTLFLDSLEIDLSDDQELYKQMMLECVEEADHIVDALFTYSKIKSNPENIQDFIISKAYDQATHNLANKVQLNNAKISFECADIKIHADLNLITQIFYHLLDNAIKFKNPDAAPNIFVTVTADGDYVLINVQDNGIGLSPEKIDHCTTILRQLHPKGQYEGSGTGLAIVKKIASIHGGSIDILDTQNHGAEILVKIKVRS